MKRPLFSRSRLVKSPRDGERGITMALVAICMVAILAMAVLSIDTVTLYLAREEAQRSADAAALAGARILSLSGMTGDPTDATNSWTPACNAATAVATAVAQQNQIAGQSLPTAQITVIFPNNTGCGTTPVFGINPEITVKVQRQNLPSFFARIWGRTSNEVGASATAEAFNPSNSGSVNSGPSGGIIPVQPRCVKPWIVPNKDPSPAGGTFVSTGTGSISNPGVLQLGGGVIGETFNIQSACNPGLTDCDLTPTKHLNNPLTSSGSTLQYVPAAIATSPYTAVESCPAGTGSDFQMAIDGCDQKTQYSCGTLLGANINLDIPPVYPTAVAGDTSTAVQCLINQSSGGQDTLHGTSLTTPAFPFQIWAGSGSPLAKSGIVNDSDPITSSNSIVSLPIYDSGSPIAPLLSNHQAVTIVGFLQVFINNVD